MYRKKKISFYFPCRNEGAHLAEEVARIPSFVDEVIIVSNRSNDNTVEVAKKMGLTVLVDDRAKNGIGYGYAHITGTNAATGDIIVTADADGTYPIFDLQKMIDHMLDNKIDFLSCNRYPLKEKGAVGWILQFGVKVLNIQTTLLYRTSIHDILSGMWLFTKEIKDDLRMTEGDWNMSPQIKINAATNKNIRFDEYHIRVDARKGRTKQQYLKTGLNHMTWLFKNKLKLKN